jgi:hypothetical protein
MKGLRKATKTFRIVSLHTEIWTGELPIMKWASLPLNRYVRRYDDFNEDDNDNAIK